MEMSLKSIAKRREIKMTKIRIRLRVWIQDPSHKYRFQKQMTSMNPQRNHLLRPLSQTSHNTDY